MSASAIPSSSLGPISGPDAREVALPKETALRLNISTSMLRKLTLAGEIGHVRLGTGAQRQRIGYTEAQIADFIAARTVPPTTRDVESPGASPGRPSRRRATRANLDTGSAAAHLLDVALATGAVSEWGGRT